MCEFFGVSRSGYYDWVRRGVRADRDEPIGKLIMECQKKTNNTYGYRRVKIWLLRENGLVINHKAVLRIMNKYGLLSQIRRRRKYYGYCEQYHKYENQLGRNFQSDKPNRKWVTDVTYIFTKQGVLYLSAIKDLYDNFIVAYNVTTENNNQLVFDTLKQAKKEIAEGLILHSDQGYQYTSPGYFSMATEYGILPSMSRAGSPLDNAPAENFFGILKTECLHRHKPQDNDEARLIIDDFIHFYNYERIQLKTKLTPFEKRCQLA
jgi:transposase InsO family protein